MALPVPAELDERWTLVAQHRERLLRLLRTRCTTHQDAEDCAHEAMLRVATFPRLDPERAAQMLTVVALRLAVDEHRRPQRRRRALLRMFASTVARSPEDVALDRIAATQALAHTTQLGAAERSVLMLRAQGAGAAEVAGELGLSYKSAESAYTRARRKMRAAAAATVAMVGLAARHVLSGPSTASAMCVAALAVVAVTVPSPSAAGAARDGGANSGVTMPDMHMAAGRVRAEVRDGGDGSRITSVSSLQVGRRAAGGVLSPDGAQRPAGTPVADVKVQAAGVDAPVSQHRYNGQQSFSQSLVQCASGGLSLDPSHLGCQP